MPAERPDGTDAHWWYLTAGGAVVVVSATDPEGKWYEYHCTGCGEESNEPGLLKQILTDANSHSARCRATLDDPRRRNAAETAGEVAAELRAELPRIDAKAAAGTTLSAAVLIGLVGVQSALPEQVVMFGIAGGAFLTIAVVLYLTVLLPAGSGRGSQASPGYWASFESGETLAADLASTDQAARRAAAVIALSRIVRTKYRRLWMALIADGIGVVALATGAAAYVLAGGR